MRITDEQFPVLKKLASKQLGKFTVHHLDSDDIQGDLLEFLKESFVSNSNAFSKGIKYLSKPLLEAVMLAKDKMLESDILNQLTSTSGTLILGDQVYCYRINTQAGSDEWNYEFFVFKGHSLLCFAGQDHENTYNWSSFIVTQSQELQARKNASLGAFYHCLVIINFLRFADIETKYLPVNRQIWDGPTCLYNNKSNYQVEIIDSTWFTTLIKSDGFKVRGHFRLQPCGEGMTKRKLVWINEFQKNGYTRKARKIEAGIA